LVSSLFKSAEKLNKNILRSFSNMLGFHTDRKIIFFLSDDWGGVRVRSNEARENLIKAGIKMDGNRFDRFDMLESNDDIEHLYEVLLRHKDFNGNYPVVTAVTCVANPDFRKIFENEFSNYYYEPFVETLSRYPNHDRVYELYKKGKELNIFRPELHGREHLQVAWWLRYLKNKNPFIMRAFENEFWYLDGKYLNNSLDSRLDIAYSIIDLSEVEQQKLIVTEAANLFKELFGYISAYFTPPSQYYHSNLEKIMFDSGIKIIDVPRLRKMPLGHGKFLTKFHYLGQQNKLGQYYLTRNAIFEPNISDFDDGVDVCLAAIETCFRYRKPAIISNHRVGFVGGINIKNRDKGLRALESLLSQILTKWPDVEFLNVVDLSNLWNN
jgi:hypothetical protein